MQYELMSILQYLRFSDLQDQATHRESLVLSEDERVFHMNGLINRLKI